MAKRPTTRPTTSATKTSAGILMYRRSTRGLEVLLGHPGGPFWARKDDGAWSILKGEFDPAREEPFPAACREFTEETGDVLLGGPPIALQPIKQPGGKVVHAFAVEQDFDPAALRSNTFALEWPPRSGRVQQYPEIDRVAWFSMEGARTKLLAGQLDLLTQLERTLAAAAKQMS